MSWKEVLKSQNDDLAHLQAVNAQLTAEEVDLDTELSNVMKRSMKVQPPPKPSIVQSIRESSSSGRPDSLNLRLGKENDGIRSAAFGLGADSAVSEVTPNAGGRRPDPEDDDSGVGESPRGATPRAPAATERYQKAKIKMLTQQVNEGQELRKKVAEQLSDVQRQLQHEREDSKKLRKRIQILETENRRTNNTKRPSEARVEDVNRLEQDTEQLKKDLATAERIAKQADTTSKAKDLQLKRATETITRLKAQLQEVQDDKKTGTGVEMVQLEEAENRNKTLEKQLSDLVDAFKKQMKLIDILKRQKVHIEAARLLNFTEEEFMKTLGWLDA